MNGKYPRELKSLYHEAIGIVRMDDIRIEGQKIAMDLPPSHSDRIGQRRSSYVRQAMDSCTSPRRPCFSRTPRVYRNDMNIEIRKRSQSLYEIHTDSFYPPTWETRVVRKLRNDRNPGSALRLAIRFCKC